MFCSPPSAVQLIATYPWQQEHQSLVQKYLLLCCVWPLLPVPADSSGSLEQQFCAEGALCDQDLVTGAGAQLCLRGAGWTLAFALGMVPGQSCSSDAFAGHRKSKKQLRKLNCWFPLSSCWICCWLRKLHVPVEILHLSWGLCSSSLSYGVIGIQPLPRSHQSLCLGVSVISQSFVTKLRRLVGQFQTGMKRANISKTLCNRRLADQHRDTEHDASASFQSKTWLKKAAWFHAAFWIHVIEQGDCQKHKDQGRERQEEIQKLVVTPSAHLRWSKLQPGLSPGCGGWLLKYLKYHRNCKVLFALFSCAICFSSKREKKERKEEEKKESRSEWKTKKEGKKERKKEKQKIHWDWILNVSLLKVLVFCSHSAYVLGRGGGGSIRWVNLHDDSEHFR